MNLKENWFKAGILVCLFLFVIKGYIKEDYSRYSFYSSGMRMVDKETKSLYVWKPKEGQYVIAKSLVEFELD